MNVDPESLSFQKTRSMATTPLSFHFKADERPCTLCGLTHRPFTTIHSNALLTLSDDEEQDPISVFKDGGCEWLPSDSKDPFESFESFQKWCSRCRTYVTECACSINITRQCKQCLEWYQIDARDIVFWCYECYIPL